MNSYKKCKELVEKGKLEEMLWDFNLLITKGPKSSRVPPIEETRPQAQRERKERATPRTYQRHRLDVFELHVGDPFGAARLRIRDDPHVRNLPNHREKVFQVPGANSGRELHAKHRPGVSFLRRQLPVTTNPQLLSTKE